MATSSFRAIDVQASTGRPRGDGGELPDISLVARARSGEGKAYELLIRRYRSFIRMRSSSYFLLGGEQDDLIQEGMFGLYKAIRDFRPDRESSFRNFAELCISRQMISAVKTAARNKHSPLNQCVSFATTATAPGGDGDAMLEEFLAGPLSSDPASRVIASEEFASLVECLATTLSDLESRVLALYLEDYSYEEISEMLECSNKAVDNALQRIKKKIDRHLTSRASDS